MLKGTFICLEDSRCVVDAETSTGTVTLTPGEKLSLKGTAQQLTGELGFQGNKAKNQNGELVPAVFPIEAKIVVK